MSTNVRRVTTPAGDPIQNPPADHATALPRYANDTGIFPAPDRFDIAREANPHLTFGHGPRFCVGAPLARIELEAAIPVTW